MGADFRNRWLFVGDRDDPVACDRAARHLREALTQAGYHEVAREQDAERSLVVALAGAWVFVGDSAGSAEAADREGFDPLSRAASTLAPVVAVKMSDDAAVHFELYRDGRLVDRFGNAAFPFYRFEHEREAEPYRGRPELWADLLTAGGTRAALRSAWVQDWRAPQILVETGRLMGWAAELLWVGYTHDSEGLPEKYDEYLADSGVGLDAFTEYHFRRVGDAAEPLYGPIRMNKDTDSGRVSSADGAS
jgi:hypothetical protein